MKKSTLIQLVKNSGWYVYAGLALVIAIQWLVVPPFGSFALGGDWAPALSVRTLAKFGEAYYPTWLSVSSHTLILYGALLAKVFGFSFDVLRIGTTVLTLVSAWLLYALCRKMQIAKVASGLIAAIVITNPLITNLSYTFSGDIMAMLLLIVGFYFCFKAFEKDSDDYLFLASLTSVIGFFARQVNIVLLAAIAIVYIRGVLRKEYSLARSIVTIIVPILIGVTLYAILYHFYLIPENLSPQRIVGGAPLVVKIITNTGQITLLLSLFLSPLTIGLLAGSGEYVKRYTFWLSGSIGAAVAITLGYFQTHFDFLGNTITRYGLGVARDVMQGDLVVWGSPLIYQIIYVAAGFLAGALIFIIIHNRKIFSLKSEFTKVVTLVAIIYGGILCCITSYDRYLILLLPTVLILLAPLFHLKYSKIVIVVLVLIQWGYGLVGTHNYLAWNKARWTVAARTLERVHQVAPMIEGGYEWNGWNYYEENEGVPMGKYTPPWAPWYIKEIYPGHIMPYIISFSPLEGYDVIDQEPVDGWLNFPTKTIYANRVKPKK